MHTPSLHSDNKRIEEAKAGLFNKYPSSALTALSLEKHMADERLEFPRALNRAKITKLPASAGEASLKSFLPNIYASTVIIPDSFLPDVNALRLMAKRYSSSLGDSIRLSFTVLNRRFSLLFENDIFANRDWYYTNGIGIEFVHPDLMFNPLTALMIPYPENAVNEYAIRIRQQMYTPHNPDFEGVPYGDRPFAGTLLFELSRLLYDEKRNLLLRTAMDFGMIGPASLGGTFQNFVHKGSFDAWKYEVGNDILVDYYTSVKKILVGKDAPLCLCGMAGLDLGSLSTGAEFGFGIEGGGLPFEFPLMKPDMSPSHEYPAIKLKLNSAIRFVAYDARLQGGIFNSSSYYALKASSIERILFKYELSCELYKNPFLLRIFYLWHSKDFVDGRPHAWAGFIFSMDF